MSKPVKDVSKEYATMLRDSSSQAAHAIELAKAHGLDLPEVEKNIKRFAEMADQLDAGTMVASVYE